MTSDQNVRFRGGLWGLGFFADGHAVGWLAILLVLSSAQLNISILHIVRAVPQLVLVLGNFALGAVKLFVNELLLVTLGLVDGGLGAVDEA